MWGVHLDCGAIKENRVNILSCWSKIGFDGQVDVKGMDLQVLYIMTSNWTLTSMLLLDRKLLLKISFLITKKDYKKKKYPWRN